MILTQIDVRGLRNLRDISLNPAPGFNLITGDNGAGKSSILEAIHCLSVGHSFRTRKVRELITRGEDEFTLACQMLDRATAQTHRSGLRRHRDGSTELRLNYEEIRSIAPVTKLLPVKALTPDSHGLIQDGPSGRRSFIDWGTFHVEQGFFEAWKIYRRALSQRNQSLKDNAPDSELNSWDEQLVVSGTQIDGYRRAYTNSLQATLTELLNAMESMFHVELSYRSGWTDGSDLSAALAKSLPNCRRFRTTTVGPHRAELQINTDDGVLARQILSRGQQKLLVYALHLAQLILLHQITKKPAVVLCDDLPSELDQEQSGKILTQLSLLNSQVFLTSTEPQSLPNTAFEKFSVVGGELRKEV